MGFNCGIVGLPNVGKSTIFNALTKGKAPAANYPFTTVHPNVGIVSVEDERLVRITGLSPAQKVTMTHMEIVDIAGLVKGASSGEGLGNQFLSHIGGVDALLHVVRVFTDDNVTHVTGTVDPVRDVEIVRTELMLKDLEVLSKVKERLEKAARGQDKQAALQLASVIKAMDLLNKGKNIRSALSEEELIQLKGFQLLTLKPVLYVANVAESEVTGEAAGALKELEAIASEEGSEVLRIAGKIEEEISEIEDAERGDYLKSIGLEESGLDRLVRAGYRLLGLITFFTTSDKENRAWTLLRSSRAPQAAGKVHSDFERGFIRAEVTSYDDFIACGGEHGARERGRLRTEGRDYLVQDGDIIYFHFSA